MKVVILAGGLGTRLSEETEIKPKPMVEIGQKPILWHIMKVYSNFGFNDFIICTGYKSYLIKEYFHHYYMHLSDITIDLQNNEIQYYNSKAEPWKITIVDTGLNTMTGGRIKRIQDYIDGEPFMLTYGDGVGNINIHELIAFHKKTKQFATLTAVQPSGKFGSINIDNNNSILSFVEKPKGDGGWVNAGYFVLEPEIFNYLNAGDSTIWEQEPLENLAKEGQLSAYKHTRFWKPMDTLRDKIELNTMWETGEAPWKIW